MSNFKLVKLEDLVQRVKVGFVGQINEFYCEEKDGVPLIRTTDLNESGINYSNLKFVTKEFHAKNKKSQIKKGDILIARHGDNGKASVFKENFDAQVLNAVIIEPNQDILDSELIKIFFESPYVKKQILGVVKGSVQGVINTSHIANLLIPLNQEIDYKQASEIISLLDRKFELNNRINAELEAMVQLVFRQRFVENRETANWEVGKLGDVAENIRRSVNPHEIKPDTCYIGLENMPRKSIALTEWGNAHELESNKYIFKDGEFLFGKLRPYFHKVGIAPVDGVCSTDILVIAPKSPEWYGYVLGHISSGELIKYAHATSAGTKMPRTNWLDISRFSIPIPPVEKARKFSEFFSPIAKQIRTNVLENQTLSELRDWLLPMLMNGQVKVK